MRFNTRLIHEAQQPDPLTGAVNPPVYLSSTFQQKAPNVHSGYVYGRSGNPTRAVLEATLGALESGRAGLAFSSGLGALTTLIEAFPSGSRVVAVDDLYGGTYRLFEHHRRQFGLRVDYVDTTDLARVRAALGTKADLVYLESPTNPLLKVTDLRAVARLAKAAGALVAVDNTFATPALQRPLELGADIVLHSTTKYLGGHSDLIGGALVCRDRRQLERFRWYQNTQGGILGPLESFLVLRGIHTLGLRVRAHCQNARKVAAFLARHPKVVRTLYPGLPDHPGYPVARRQMDDFGGMVSAEIRGGLPGARRVLRRLKLFTLAESLGGVESLVNHPALMTHRSVPAPVREAQGITGGLLRFSVGVEAADDLVADLEHALG